MSRPSWSMPAKFGVLTCTGTPTLSSVQTQLEYASQVWSPCLHRNTNSLKCPDPVGVCQPSLESLLAQEHQLSKCPDPVGVCQPSLESLLAQEHQLSQEFRPSWSMPAKFGVLACTGTPTLSRVQTQLEYASQVWSPCLHRNTNSLKCPDPVGVCQPSLESLLAQEHQLSQVSRPSWSMPAKFGVLACTGTPTLSSVQTQLEYASQVWSPCLHRNTNSLSVQTQLEYASQVWSPCLHRNTNSLSVQTQLEYASQVWSHCLHRNTNSLSVQTQLEYASQVWSHCLHRNTNSLKSPDPVGVCQPSLESLLAQEHQLSQVSRNLHSKCALNNGMMPTINCYGSLIFPNSLNADSTMTCAHCSKLYIVLFYFHQAFLRYTQDIPLQRQALLALQTSNSHQLFL